MKGRMRRLGAKRLQLVCLYRWAAVLPFNLRLGRGGSLGAEADFLLAPRCWWTTVSLMRAGILLLSSLLAAGVLRAEEDKIDANLLKLFEARVYRDASGGSLPYRLYKPANYDPKQKYPLVLFLHGAVGAGKDNRRQFNGGNEVPSKALTAAENQSKYPCFILAPQCSAESRWARYGGEVHPTEPTRRTLAVSDGLPKGCGIA